MNTQEIASLVNGTLVTSGMNSEKSFTQAFASDLMSDVLTVDCNNLLLITGLLNIQTIRTAEMSEIGCILLVRNKKATPEMITLASESNICLIESPFSLFRASGLLYQAGINPVY